MQGIKPLWHGFDTAKVGYLVRWPSSFQETLTQFVQYREFAQCAEQLQMFSRARLGTCPQEFIVRPTGARMLPFAFEAMGFVIFIGNTLEPWVAKKATTPNVRVEFQPFSIAQHGLACVHEAASQVIRGMGGQIEGNMLSELHMTCDLETDRPHMPSDYHGSIDNLWSKVKSRIRSNGQYHDVDSANMDMHTSSQRLKLVNIGKDKKMLRVYDKMLELETHRDKLWEALLWGSEIHMKYMGMSRSKGSPTSVMRIEFQMRREKLIEVCIATVEDALKNQASLWQHLTQESVVMIENDDANRSRCSTQQWWQLVQKVWSETDAPMLPRRIKGLPSYEKYVDQGMGLCLALGARLGQSENLQFKDIADVLETAWEAKNSESWRARMAQKRQKLEILWADLDNAKPVIRGN